MYLIRNAFKHLRYSGDVIAQFVRWYQAYSLSLPDLGIHVDHSTLDHKFCSGQVSAPSRGTVGISATVHGNKIWLIEIQGVSHSEPKHSGVLNLK